MIHQLIKNILIYGAFGITGEVLFTALKSKKLTLTGESHAWMLPIYGLGALVYPWLYPLLMRAHVQWYYRGLLYALIIIGVEYATGIGIKKLIGSCPWEYSHGRIVNWLYFPVWFIVGFIGEFIYRGIIS